MTFKTTNARKSAADLIAEIMERAPLAAAVLARQDEAFAAEQSAEARILALAVAIAKPALGTVVSRVEGLLMEAAEVAPDLWITEDGALFEWNTNGLGPAMEPIPTSPAEAVMSWELTEILATMARLLRRQVEGRHKSATLAELNARRLEAIAKLVEG
jgi:hypothetical protein